MNQEKMEITIERMGDTVHMEYNGTARARTILQGLAIAANRACSDVGAPMMYFYGLCEALKGKATSVGGESVLVILPKKGT